MAFSQRFAPDFYDRLHEDLRSQMESAGLDLLLLDHPDDIAYVTGFAHWPTERPIIFAITADLAIQERGTNAMAPGRPCREPNRIALEAIRAAGGDYILHRLGHGMGVAFHEPPWAEDGDSTVMEPGMILSSEPAVYVPGLGGFRLADTVLLTETGQGSLTRFPRALEEIVIA